MAEPVVAEATRPVPESEDMLPVVRSVLREIDARGVRYCHWKSNENLGRALNGDTDLDLLVAPADRATFTTVVRQHGFRLFLNPPIRRIPGIEDQLGLDESTGRIVHLHVHYRLVLGERHVKEHHLPVEAWLLTDPDRRQGVPIPRPEKELLLLSVRAVLKVDALSSLVSSMRRSELAIPVPIRDELRSLRRRSPDPALRRALATSGLPLPEAELRDFLDRVETDRLPAHHLIACKHAMLRALRPYERHSRLRATARRVGLRVRFDSRVQRLLPVPHKRFPHRGMLVAVVGADGSGKSRLVADVDQWLSSKLDVSTLYFGQPKRNRGLIALRRIAKLSRRAGMARPVSDCLDGLVWIYVASVRAVKGSAATRRVARGQIVLAERFPLEAFATMDQPMDGPRLRNRPGLLRAAESLLYRGLPNPDLVVVLSAPLSVLHARAPDTNPAEHAAKVRGVYDLRASRYTAIVDAAADYDKVFAAARQRIWDHIKSCQERL